MRNELFIIVIGIFLLNSCLAFSEQKPVIGIQPLGDIDTTLFRIVYAGIDSVYDVYIVFFPVVDLPEYAYYEPRKRYRAEKILKFLELHSDKTVTKIMGLTGSDISTTKGEHEDWGIFGLAHLGGYACVVSTYRLGRKKVSFQQFQERVIKVANHELGHTFGLDHCPTKTCLMEDARGTIVTVDNETGTFCTFCAEQARFVARRTRDHQ